MGVLSGMVDRLGRLAQPAQRLLPLSSAVVGTGLGVAISARALLAYFA